MGSPLWLLFLKGSTHLVAICSGLLLILKTIVFYLLSQVDHPYWQACQSDMSCSKNREEATHSCSSLVLFFILRELLISSTLLVQQCALSSFLLASAETSALPVSPVSFTHLPDVQPLSSQSVPFLISFTFCFTESMFFEVYFLEYTSSVFLFFYKTMPPPTSQGKCVL